VCGWGEIGGLKMYFMLGVLVILLQIIGFLGLGLLILVLFKLNKVLSIWLKQNTLDK
jgi:hypothetical protein